jgi:hypothetical protein
MFQRRARMSTPPSLMHMRSNRSRVDTQGLQGLDFAWEQPIQDQRLHYRQLQQALLQLLALQ